MTEALRAEWTKLRTLTSTGWLLIGTVALTVGGSAAIDAATHVSSDNRQDPTRLSLIGVDVGQTVIVILAVLAITDEYGTGMIRVTLSAVPRRLVHLVAKAANVAGLALVAGLLAVAPVSVLCAPAAGAGDPGRWSVEVRVDDVGGVIVPCWRPEVAPSSTLPGSVASSAADQSCGRRQGRLGGSTGRW